MSDLGTYTFLPWARQGIANQVLTPETGTRAEIDVGVSVQAEARGGGQITQDVTRAVALYGPGDITGIDNAAISRREPENWVTNFEPNYFASIEFYEEDFLWRYTPAAVVAGKLAPWLTLIVLEEDKEFVDGNAIHTRPLGFIDITAPLEAVFPASDEISTFAHVHVNDVLSAKTVETSQSAISSALSNLIDRNSDSGCCRLLCPRKLKPKTGYHAFLVPSFEAGRLAGLGLDPEPIHANPDNGLVADSIAWEGYDTQANRPEPTHFPYYYRWFFKTAEQGDFETLVRALVPKPVDARVGRRDMDVTDPAPHIAGIADEELNGILRLGGALRAPLSNLDAQGLDEHETFDNWAAPYPHEFQSQLSDFLNLATEYQTEGASANGTSSLEDAVTVDPDPLVTPPIYGRWHALVDRLLSEADGTSVPNNNNWLHDLNLDPRFRVAAGFGTGVIQEQQENYMKAAWDQIGEVIEANRLIRSAQAAMYASRELHRKHLEPLVEVAPEGAILITTPVSGRVLSEKVTVRSSLVSSPQTLAFSMTAMRRALRPDSTLLKRTDAFKQDNQFERNSLHTKMFARANVNDIEAAPAKAELQNTLTHEAVNQPVFSRDGIRAPGRFQPGGRPTGVSQPGARPPGTFQPGGRPLGGVRPLDPRIRLDTDRLLRIENLIEREFLPELITDLPDSQEFNLITEISPVAKPEVGPSKPGGRDSQVSLRFKRALRTQYDLIAISRELGELPEVSPVNSPKLARDAIDALHPELTVPRHTLSGIQLPDRVIDQAPDDFVEAMAYPEFDDPMYEPLVKSGVERFVPNLHLVAQNSITLLETNQRFIEAYMVGLNHEFARELLWREYPTDQRGSYFRQFWDVRKKLAEAGYTDAARENLKDIKEIHEWPASNDLGDNDNREAGTAAEEELVLVIRGELLKKYPNTVISAQPAKWQTKSDGRPDKTLERVLDPDGEPIFPIYEARVAPDLYFFGFDLTAEEARGDDDVDNKPGYYFRIEEVPGDARFGFDVEREADTDINVWNDLAWNDVNPGFAHGDVLQVADIPSTSLVEPIEASLSEKVPQWNMDKDIAFGSGIRPAEFAYVALQTPVLMAVHAGELLPEEGD